MAIRKRLGVLVSHATLPNNRLTVEGIMKKAYAYGYDVCVFASFIRNVHNKGYQDGELNIFNLANVDALDGLIVLGDSIQVSGYEQELEEKLHAQCNCPVVVLDRESQYFPHVSINDEATIEKLVDHLIECHGFTKINCLTGFKGHIHAENRIKGYCNSLRKHNLPVEEERIAYGDFWLNLAAEYAHKVINKEVPWPEAIVCANDYSAIAVVKELVAAGIRVPEDMVVVGYDSCKDGIGYIPSITSADMPFYTHGSNAVIMLHNIIEGTKEPIDTVTSGNLCIAQSCGCNNDIFYKRRLENLDKNNDYLFDFFSKSSFMKENLTSATTIDACMEEVAHNTYQLSKYKEFYVCLCEDWDIIAETGPEEEDELGEAKKYRVNGYAPNMCLYVSDINGEKCFDRTKFHTKEMLPALSQERDYPTTYIFTPIHFIDRCFGYMAINFGEDITMIESFYRGWNRNINNAIEIVRSHNEMVYYNQKLNDLAEHDELTGLNNRLGFNNKAKLMIKDCRENRKQFLMIVGDMDNLKGINDVFGHLEGDSAIKTVAKAFNFVKGKDSYVARLGGDEFVIIINGSFNDNYVNCIFDNIYKYLELYNATSGKPYKIRISLGCYYNYITDEETQDNEILDEYLYVSDQFMYQIKQGKKDVRGQ